MGAVDATEQVQMQSFGPTSEPAEPVASHNGAEGLSAVEVMVLVEAGKKGAVATEELQSAPAFPKSRKDSLEPLPYYKLFSTADGQDKAVMLLATIGALGNGVLLPVFALVFGDFMDTFGNPSADFLKEVTQVALKFLYLAIAAAFASYLEAGFWMYTGNRQANKLRIRYLQALLRQDVTFFDVHSTTGGLLQGLNEDSLDVQNAISEKLGQFMHHMTSFVAGFAIAFVRGWEQSLVMLGCMPFLALLGGLLAKRTTQMATVASESYAEAASIAQQSISQIRTVAAYNQEERTMQAYEKALDAPRKMAIKHSLISGASLGGLQFVIYGTYAAGLFFGAYRVAAGAYTGGQVLQVILATLNGGFSLGQAGPIMQYFAKGRAAGARMFKVIQRVPAIDVGEAAASDVGGLDAARSHSARTAPAAVGRCNKVADDGAGAEQQQQQVLDVPEKVQGQLELRNVDFAYPICPDRLVFRNFSLEVPAGRTVALVGSSGSGKSTVVGLVERFYDPLAGQVLLDGRDMRSLPLQWLRSQMGLVTQEPTLFATTIFENVMMGRPGSSPEEVEAAARAANAHSFASALPLGYHTQVGERGTQLSGGQKQRIAIARAILKNPKILLLDEATSALDTRSERLVQDALDRMVVGRTTVVVAHRLSTIKGADSIAVVVAGQVVEQGTHEQLLKDSAGAYSNLVKLQMQARDGEDEADSSDSDDPDAPITQAQDQQEASGSPSPLMAAMAAAATAMSSSARQPSAAVPSAKSLAALSVASTGGKAHGESVVVAMPPAAQAGRSLRPGSGDLQAAAGRSQASLGGKREEPYKVPVSRLLAYNKRQWPLTVMGCLASVGVGVQHPAFAYVISCMITTFYTASTSELKSDASFYSWMFFVIGSCAFLFTIAQQLCFGVMGFKLARRLRAQLLEAILRQEVAWFDDEKHSSGKLALHLSSDAAHVRGAVGDVIGLVLSNVATLAVGYFISFAFDWRMALLVTGVLPFFVLSAIIQMRFVSGFSSDADKFYAGANQAVTEALGSIRVIHAYKLQGFVVGLYQRLSAAANASLVRQSVVSGLGLAYSNFVLFGMFGLIVYFLGQEVDKGWTEFSDSLKAFMTILLGAVGMAQAASGFPDIAPAKGAIQRIFPIIDRKPRIDSSSEEGLKPDPQAVRGEIEFRGVRFAYPARPAITIFRNFNLSVPAGQATALVGESGSGKSTVVGLVERFYDPLAGQVLLDGVDVRQYHLRSLRALVALVSQEPMLFSGTVADNILFGRPDATQQEVEAAAEVAFASAFIQALPSGYSTRVGDGGVQLSGGQKQRIAIARAVIKNPKILLLDEATSALDASSEAVVQAALERLMAGRTSLVIAHRLSTIRNVAQIAVVYRGTVLEKGTHDELMALPNGNYARLVEIQSKGKGAGPEPASSADGTGLRARRMPGAGPPTSPGGPSGASITHCGSGSISLPMLFAPPLTLTEGDREP